MRLHVIAAALAVVVASIAASAAEPAAGGRRAENPERVTCRIVRPVGSRLGGVRTCRTAAQWAAYQAEVRDVVHRVQGEGATFCVPNPNNPVPTC